MKKKSILMIVSALLVIFILVGIGCSNATPDESLKPPKPGEKGKSAGPPTFVPAKMTPEQYVNRYYTLYKQKKWSEAYKMLPAENKAKRDLKKYTAMNESMPLKSYSITKKDKAKNSLAITVRMALDIKQPGFEKWDTQWTFIQHKQGWMVAGYQVGVAK